MKQLVEKKGAFSAGGQWFAFGFQLLGSRALIRAQVQQVEAERKGKERALAKKKGREQSKTRKAEEALSVWTNTGKLMANQWKDILKFALAQWEPKAPLSKYSTMAKAKTKMEEFSAKFNRPWKELLAEEITKVASEQAALAGVVATPSEFENLHLDEDSDAASLGTQSDVSDAEPDITDQAEC